MARTGGSRHHDPGLQPERTVLAWGRTLLGFTMVSAVFLRWLPHYGAWMLVLVATAGLTSAVIHGSQRRRYRRQVRGIHTNGLRADVTGVLALTAATLGLGTASMIAVVLVAVGVG